MPRRTKIDVDKTPDTMVTVKFQEAVPRPSSCPPPQPATDMTSKPSEFAFINISAPDKARDPDNRRKVRKHVMKDIGISRRRGPAGETSRAPSRVRFSQPNSGTPTPTPMAGPSFPTPNPVHEPSLAIDQLPAHENIPIDPQLSYDQSPSFTPAFPRHDTGLDYLDDLVEDFCGVNVMSNFLRVKPKPLGESEASVVRTDESVEKYIDSIEKVRRTLEKGGSLDMQSEDNVVKCVIMLACHALSGVQLDQCDIHRDGYQRIVHGHGGFSALESNETLQYALMWTDLLGSLSSDSAPKAPLPQGVVIFRESLHLNSHPSYEILQQRYPAAADVVPILPLLHPTTQTVQTATEEKPPSSTQNNNHRAWVSWAPYYAIATYDLLSLPRPDNTMNPTPESNLRAALRAALRTFINLVAMPFDTIECCEGFYKFINFDESGRFVRKLTDIDWEGLEDLQLWLLLVASMSSLGADREDMIQLLKKATEHIGLETWPQVMERVKRVAWVETRLDRFSTVMAEKVFGKSSDEE